MTDPMTDDHFSKHHDDFATMTRDDISKIHDDIATMQGGSATTQAGVDMVQTAFAQRIGGLRFGLNTPVYKFERIKQAKRHAVQVNPDMALIDLGVGEPDAMADDAVVRVLQDEATKPENRFYADNGILEFKRAAATYMRDVFGVVDLDPETEIIPVVGSKSALAMLPAAFIDPDDVVLMPSPGYPVLATSGAYYGGRVVSLPLHEEHAFLPDFTALSPDDLQQAKLLYLNYPNNPTGAMASAEFFEQVVDFARQHSTVVVHDAAYAALVFDGVKPLSFLAAPGAKDVGVELHSLSKSFNMTGWRIGFMAGNAQIIKAFAAVKDNSDSGQFIPIQKAAAYALAHPEITRQTAQKYARRHALLCRVLALSGFRVQPPGASFFLYTRIPRRVRGGVTFASAADFSDYLIREHLISTVPWDEVGPYVRFSVTYEAATLQDEERVMQAVRDRLERVTFEF